MLVKFNLFSARKAKYANGASHILYTEGIAGTPVARGWLRDRSGVMKVEIDLEMLRVYLSNNKGKISLVKAVYKQGLKDGELLQRKKPKQSKKPKIKREAYVDLPPLSYFTNV